MKILFLGEEKGSSAEYLRQSLEYLGHHVTHFGCNEEFNLKKLPFDVVVISDYPAQKIDFKKSQLIIDFVESGKVFIMLGGWISFNGKGNSYYNHPISKLLPVNLKEVDDRVNYHQGLIICPSDEIKNQFKLNWNIPPVICGYNDADAKDLSKKIIFMKKIETNGNEIAFGRELPLVTSIRFGKGVSIACLTDVAPHWCGGLVDWGKERVKLETVEVGDQFIAFIEMIFSVKFEN